MISNLLNWFLLKVDSYKRKDVFNDGKVRTKASFCFHFNMQLYGKEINKIIFEYKTISF